MTANYRTVLVPLLLLVCYTCCCLGMDSEVTKCSACEAVATELQRRLEAEVPRTHLDLRHRLDKDGQRYGKIIDWKLSEIRAVELLEDLCDAMSDYTIITPTNSPDSSSSSSETDGSNAAEQQEQQQHPIWVKYRGEGSTHVDGSLRPAKPEEELRVKQLKTFCGMLLESKEEEVVEALMTDQFAAGVAPVLCQQITSRCQGKVYSAISSEDEDTQSEAAAREL